MICVIFLHFSSLTCTLKIICLVIKAAIYIENVFKFTDSGTCMINEAFYIIPFQYGRIVGQNTIMTVSDIKH